MRAEGREREGREREGREREERLQGKRERGWERWDREGGPPGTAKARDEADRDDWCP